MAESLKRDAQLARAASIRAMLIAGLSEFGANSVRGLCEAFSGELAALQANDVTVRNILERSLTAGLVGKRRGTDNVTVYYVELERGDLPSRKKAQAGERSEINKEPLLGYDVVGAPPKISKHKKSPAQPSLTIDIVKSTGRIRLDVGGFVIDIGIKD